MWPVTDSYCARRQLVWTKRRSRRIVGSNNFQTTVISGGIHKRKCLATKT
jgi:hypothetical protein